MIFKTRLAILFDRSDDVRNLFFFIEINIVLRLTKTLFNFHVINLKTVFFCSKRHVTYLKYKFFFKYHSLEYLVSSSTNIYQLQALKIRLRVTQAIT